MIEGKAQIEQQALARMHVSQGRGEDERNRRLARSAFGRVNRDYGGGLLRNNDLRPRDQADDPVPFLRDEALEITAGSRTRFERLEEVRSSKHEKLGGLGGCDGRPKRPVWADRVNAEEVSARKYGHGHGMTGMALHAHLAAAGFDHIENFRFVTRAYYDRAPRDGAQIGPEG